MRLSLIPAMPCHYSVSQGQTVKGSVLMTHATKFMYCMNEVQTVCKSSQMSEQIFIYRKHCNYVSQKFNSYQRHSVKGFVTCS